MKRLYNAKLANNERGLNFPWFRNSPSLFQPHRNRDIFASRHPLPQDTLLQTESCSQWNHDQSFSPRFFFPPASSGSPPFWRKICPVLERPTPSLWPVSSGSTSGGKVGNGEKFGKGTFGVFDEKAAHVITFPVITRCREQFILLPVSFSSVLYSSRIFVCDYLSFFFPHCPCLFIFVSFVYFFQSFVSKKRRFCTFSYVFKLHLFFYFLISYPSDNCVRTPSSLFFHHLIFVSNFTRTCHHVNSLSLTLSSFFSSSSSSSSSPFSTFVQDTRDTLSWAALNPVFRDGRKSPRLCSRNTGLAS